MNPKRIAAAGALALAAGAGGSALALRPGRAVAATTAVTASSVSANWAGYSASGRQFSSVSGSWVQPAADCRSGSGDSAFWVGLGGTSNGSQALEQAGTQSNCTSTGATEYFAWYELLPAAPVRVDLPVKPGDRITTRVSVTGSTVTVTIRNTTTGNSVTEHLHGSSIDTSSAEWVAEAPSACDAYAGCEPVPLADFGTVKFTGASATAGGHTGPISDASWQAQAVQLNSSSSDPRFAAYDGTASAGAQTSSLSSDGSAFSVAWQQAGATGATTGSADAGYGGYAYGDYGGYGGYGYGDDGSYGDGGGPGW